jgi:hypothetical protein
MGMGLDSVVSTANRRSSNLPRPAHCAGINEKGGAKHVSFNRIAQAAQEFDLVFVFDQSFSRQQDPGAVMVKKLGELTKIGLL